MCNSTVFHRISPQSLNGQLNPEERRGEDEDEDVQAERIRTSAALSTSNSNEV